MIKWPDSCTWSPHMITAWNCTISEANTTLPSFYYKALDYCHQVFSYIKYLQFQFSIATIVVVAEDKTI